MIKNSQMVIEKANYSDLDELLICIVILTIFIPIITIILIQKSKFKSTE